VKQSQGIKMPNIREVAKAAEVSPSTVSRVLRGTVPVNDETRQRVIRAVERLKYRENELVQRACHVGIVVPHFSADDLPNHPTIYDIITQFISEMDKRQVRNSMIVIDDINSSNIENFFREKLNGYFIIGTNQEQEDALLPFFEQRGNPSMLLNRWVQDRQVNYVNIDDTKASTMATEHLIALGHRKIAFVGGDQNFRNTQLRFLGFKKACAAAGIDVPPHYIFQKNYSELSGYEAAVNIMSVKEKKPTAVFCCSDTLAIGFQRFLKEIGIKLPEEFAMIGYGDTPLSRYVSPQLTSVQMPTEEMGRQSAWALLNLIQNPLVTSTHILMKAELVIRESCGGTRL
jgi:LacI family transcriptional regulator